MKINGMGEILKEEINREPTNKELADFIGMPLKKIIEIKNYNKNITSLDSPISDDKGSDSQLNLIEDERYNFEERVEIANLHDFIENIFEGAKMKDEERDILWKRAHGKTLKKIGEDYNLTKERIRQIEKDALGKAQARCKRMDRLEKLGITLK